MPGQVGAPWLSRSVTSGSARQIGRSAWHLLEAGARQVLRDDLRCGDLEWQRGQAWAFQQAMGLVWYYDTTNPPMARLGRRTLTRLMTA